MGIARNILTARLKKLCVNGILKRVPVKEGAKRHEYRLTAKGRDMIPLLISLTQWGDRWIFGEGNEPLIFIDRKQGKPIRRIEVSSDDGRALMPRDVQLQPGPGATPAARRRINELNSQLSMDDDAIEGNS